MMPVTITFHKLSEKRPYYDQPLIWLRKTSSMHFYQYEPVETTAGYVWEHVDEEGYLQGSAVCFDPETESIDDSEQIIDGNRWKLFLRFDGWETDENDLWIGVEDYWKCFEGEE